jgi:PTH1 family peptidyl-tRNA hydrolase
MYLDWLAQKNGFAFQVESDCHLWRGELFGSKVTIVKPMTYMNLSGGPTARVMNFYKLTDLLVIHDEVDLPFGDIRYKRGGGEAGHNGLKSITEALGTRDYARIRIGIGKNPAVDTADWVLSRFSDDELAKLPELFAKISLQQRNDS